MENTKTSISNASSYTEAGEYWDEHDITEVWEQTQPVEVEIDLQDDDVTYFAVASGLVDKLRAIATQQGVSSETLLNLWVQERVSQEQTKPVL